ncbi:MAG TPA: hypothetical protein VEL28_06140, partial [Candidatus Binatia bacterium]|nr:hypothetical protein [Candidatus Binatia bacterium]
CGSFLPAASGDAAVIVFESTCDLTGDNADGNREIFLLDGEALDQITQSQGCANTSPVVNDTGTRVAFESSCNLAGSNADANTEIFLWKSGGGGISQLTQTTSALCDNLAPTITAAASNAFVAFDSNCSTHPGNTDGSFEIFRVSEAGNITPLTNGTDCDSISASGNAAGTLYAYESDCDPAGTNPDFAIEIFTATSGAAITQVTRAGDDACSSLSPAIDGTGSFIAFESDCDFDGEGNDNSDASAEIFRVAAVQDGAVVQLTDDDGSSTCASVQPVIASGGSVVAFSSFCDLGGDNEDGSLEVFRVAVGSDPEQMTESAGCSSLATAVDSSGDEILFDSDCDLTGDNADDSREIFRAGPELACVCGAPVTGASPPLASDALAILRGAVGARVCPPCACDTDASGAIVTQDALRALRKAVGADIDLTCPPA